MGQEASSPTQEKPLITVVVPVYNTEKYLRQCLVSISRQSYDHLDVVLVNDGSTDNSGEICKGFCDTDARFRLVSQDNAGLGAARNKGIDLAQGEYICFVDSDDRIHPDYVRTLYENLILYQADLSICSYRIVAENSSGTHDNAVGTPTNEIEVMDRSALLETLLTEETNEVLVAWNKLVSRDWLYGFRFENKWHEDQFMINEYILRCEKAVLTSAKLYDYRYRPESIMGSEMQHDLRHLDDLEAKEKRVQYFYTEEYRSVWKPLFLQYLNNRIFWYVKLSNKENAKKIKQIIYPSYKWGLRQYFKIGGLFRKNGDAFRMYAFLFSPKLYKLSRNQFHK